MKLIKYTHARPTSTSPPPSQRSWFGTQGKFGRCTTPLYEDNSFQKHKYLLSKDERRLNTIRKDFSKAKSHVEQLRSEIHYSYMTKKQLLTVFKRKKEKIKRIEQAVIKIQKVIRGFLTRKKYINELVGLQQKVMQIRLLGLEKNNKYYMIYLGKAPVRAAKRIQNSVRRLLFRLKIYKYREYYFKLQQDRADKIFSVIRKHLLVYTCKIRIEFRKFEKHKSFRLFQINRNLAILIIKKVYRANKWSFKVIKHRINKYKRKLRNSAYEYPAANLTVFALASHSSRAQLSERGSEFEGEVNKVEVSPEVEISSSTSEDERVMREIYLKKMEEMRKDRIKFGKISHCVGPKPSSSNILPLLYEKDIVEGVGNLSHYVSITRATASRISESRPKRYTPTIRKSKTPTPFVKFVSKRLDLKPVPLYKKETFTSKMSRWDAEVEAEEAPKVVYSKRLNSTVRNFTISQMQKRRNKSVQNVDFNAARPKTTIKPLRQFVKKIPEIRPFTINSNLLVFRSPEH